MISVATMVAQLEALLGTKDLSAWEHDFVRSVSERVQMWGGTTRLTAAQVNKLEQVYRRHFA